MPKASSRRRSLPPAQSARRRHPIEMLTEAPVPQSSLPEVTEEAAEASAHKRPQAEPWLAAGRADHQRRSFMLDPQTIERVEELRWLLHLDKSGVVRRAVELLAQTEGVLRHT